MKLLTYIWAGPTTIIGLCFALLALITGGKLAIHTGVVEASGGAVRLLLRYCTLLQGGASALTLGHVVLAQDQRCMNDSRSHERIHVRQCERWGPIFIPAYLIASAILWCRGKDAYYDNPFEREAYGGEPIR
jgi:hypothetical protein